MGCTDAGTETEPAANFGQLQVYLPSPASQAPAMASATQNKNTPPWYMVPIGWLLDQVVPPAQANPLVYQAIETQMALGAAAGTAGTANDNEGVWETQSAPPRLSEKEKLFMAAISSTPADRAQAAWGALKRALGADSDTAQHQLERLKQLADQKGRAETRVRYRFAEDEKTGGVKVVGYHTREGSGMDTVKVRYVKQTAPGTYEFREDGADSPILVWYTTASSMYQALSPQDLPQYFSQRGTPINVNTVPLDDPSMTDQTPGLEIPEQPTWRDGVMVNPQQDPDEMAGNKTETPISDGTDRGPTKTTTPVQENDFRDYILVFPIEGVPAVYVYLSQKADKDEEYYKKKIQEFESTLATEDVHGLRRHGPGTTLEQQNYRAKTGYTPDGRNGKPTDSTRFLSYKDQYEAIQKALPLYNPEIHKTGRVDFDMGKVVSEGYKKGGKEYFETSTVRAGFDKKTGKIYSIFGIE
ncbi:S-type pyocin domain-containing protein [Xenorhabdus griffiniae]|nr:S-type pyocin domain-containing protein [Xenorhabdus griffiniae]